MNDFVNCIDNYKWEDIREAVYFKTNADVEQALHTTRPGIHDFMALVSPAAQGYLEPMAQLSRRYTQQRFGKTVQFYVPLYLTNSCINHCIYCGFNHANDINRIILTDHQIRQEIEAIHRIGSFKHILLVTGENPRDAGVDYIENAIRLVKKRFLIYFHRSATLETTGVYPVD